MQNRFILTIVLMSLCVFTARAAEFAGEVRAVIGVAQLLTADGEQRDITPGQKLHVGDALKTRAGAHLHLRMVDDALLSLRPESEIKIVGYTYEPGTPEKTNIRFDLLKGTVRSVTGKGGEAAKDKFRMNTPVAAIGVRGTDFITHADSRTTLVNVQYGAIVLAPLGGECQAAALGPCQTAAARTLTADMRNMMLKLNRGESEPTLVPLGEGLQILPAPVAARNKPGADNKRAEANTLLLEDGAGPKSADLTDLADLPPRYQMVWGHWGKAPETDDLGRSYLAAAQGREITVGNASSGLFRDDNGPLALPASGQTEFSLRAAQVALTGSTVPGQVNHAALAVNFDTKSFVTRLDLQHPALADTAVMNAYGTVRSDGMIYSLAAFSTGAVQGSLSRDGTEAGYQFTLPTAAGTLNGTTLWIK